MGILTILVESDDTKLTEWSDYLKEYDRETSRSPALDLVGLDTPKKATSETMEEVLNFLGNAAPSSGPKLALIFGHANAEGLIMRITANAASAQSRNIRAVSRAWKAMDEMIKLRSAAKPGKPPFLVDVPGANRLFEGLKRDLQGAEDPGDNFDTRLPSSAITNREQADAWFDKWVEMMAKAALGGGLGETDLRRVCRAMQKVRDQRYDRIEIRGCNIGKDTENLKALKEFFGTGEVIAPKTTMFFGRLGVNSNQTGFGKLEKALGGWHGGNFVPPDTRGLMPGELQQIIKLRTVRDPSNNNAPIPAVVNGRRNRVFATPSGGDVIMQETELHEHTFKFKGRLWAPSDQAITQFAQANYKSGYQYSPGPGGLPVGGMWNPDGGTVPFLLPLESSYRSMLETSN